MAPCLSGESRRTRDECPNNFFNENHQHLKLDLALIDHFNIDRQTTIERKIIIKNHNHANVLKMPLSAMKNGSISIQHKGKKRNVTNSMSKR